ncbi:MAG: C25 family cysteine peptidase, partial [candidate division WOR-3 bacterium]
MRSIALLAAVLPQLALGSIDVMRSDATVFSFRYLPGALKMETGAAGRSHLDMADADHLAVSGEYDLPGKVLLVGLPQTGNVKLIVNPGPEQVADGEVSVVPGYSWEGESACAVPLTIVDEGRWRPAELGQFEVLRSVRCARLRLNPVRYDPVRKQIHWFEWIDVKLEFDEPATLSPVEGMFGDLIAGMLANGEQARHWSVGMPAGLRDPYDRSQFWVKVQVESTGVYRITGRELAAAGVPLAGLDPKTIALFTVGEHEPCRSYPDSLYPVGIFVEGEEDGRFDPDDRVIFYGLAPDHWVGRCSVWVKNLYTRRNVYWLTWGGMPGQRMARGLGYDTTGTEIVRYGRDVLHQEPDLDCPARSGLLWVWTKIAKDAGIQDARFVSEIDLKSPIEVRQISGRLLSRTDNNVLGVTLNGRPVGTLQFRRALPAQPFDFQIATVMPAAVNGNTIGLVLSGEGSKETFLDFLEVEYRKRLSVAAGQLFFLHDDTGNFRFTICDTRGRAFVLDVTDPYAPKLTEGLEDYVDSVRFCRRLVRPAAFCVALDRQLMRPRSIALRTPGRIRSPLLQADYWVVAPEGFMPAARELARYRTGRVLGVPNAQARAVALEDLYDDYSFGMEEPWAVKQLFADKRAKFGLLVGDATYDYKGNLGDKVPAGVPAFETGYGLDPDGTSDRSALAIDAWYADFEGEGGSPDMMLGRVTARTGQELRQFADKVMIYENAPAGFWRRRLLLLADDEYLGDPFDPRKRDAIGFTHVEQCERMAALVGRHLDPVKVYLSEFAYVAIKSKPAANAELMRQLNLGSLLWLFFGHGS